MVEYRPSKQMCVEYNEPIAGLVYIKSGVKKPPLQVFRRRYGPKGYVYSGFVVVFSSARYDAERNNVQ